MSKIIGVYRITNTITGDFYIGSSKNVKKRWTEHKCQSTWKKYPNKQMYLDFHKYGIDKFEFEILAEAESEQLKKTEQEFIEKLKPTYNNRNANGWNTERKKEYNKEYNKEYKHQLCYYNNENLTLNALYQRFAKKGIQHPTAEAKKYLL